MSPFNIALRELLGLTPDQHEQFDSLPQETLEHLSRLPVEAKALIGEVWRTSEAVANTNFEGDLDDRMKAWNDRHNVEMKWVVITGEMLDGRKADAETIAEANKQVAALNS